MPSCGATRHMKTKIMASDNVFRVGASFRTFDEMQNALRLFEQQTHSQFYMRDARTLNAAKKTTPNVVEKASKDVKYYFVKYSCLHGGRPHKSRTTTGSRPQQS